MMYDIFISYSRKDTALVMEFYDRLVALGYSVWIDKDGIESGDAFKKVIVKAIKESRLLVFFSSDSSNASPWTAKEVGIAVMERVPIIPVKLDKSAYNDDVYFDLVNLDYTDYSSVRERNLQMERFLKSVQNKLPLTGNASVESVSTPSEKPDIKKENQANVPFLALDEFEHLRRKNIKTIARKVFLSLLYLVALFFVLSMLFFRDMGEEADPSMTESNLFLLLLLVFGCAGVFYIGRPEKFRRKLHRECRDIEQADQRFLIARGWNDRYGICRVKGGWIKKILGFDYPSVTRISPMLFILQDDSGKYALFHVAKKMLTGFEADRYSVDDDIVSLEIDGKLVYYSTQGFRQNI